MKQKILDNLNTKYIGRNIIYYDIIDSTHKEAKRLTDNKEVPNGTLIVANMQTNGIGTHDRVWYTKKGENITFNLILYPNCEMIKLEHLTVLIAECIVEVIEKLYELSLQIKYPNDVMYEGKKIAGILTQAVTYEGKVKKILIGIGINVNQEIFSKQIEEIATSLKIILKKSCDREKVIAEFLNLFESKLMEIKI